MPGTISSPPGTASAPPGQKSFWTSMTSRAWVASRMELASGGGHDCPPYGLRERAQPCRGSPMLIVAALYRFTRFDDPDALRAPLRSGMRGHGVKGSLLLAPEGINGTIAGTRAGIDAVLAHIRGLPGCADLDWKESTAAQDALRPDEGAAEARDRDDGGSGDGPARAGRDLCGARRLERPDRGAGCGGDRHAQRLRDGHRHVSPVRSTPGPRVSAISRHGGRRTATGSTTSGSRCSAPAGSGARNPRPT
jgi:hypothetical protein